ncbi:hypothetical protein JAAARDRAFT_41745 [Jaapia argillacea MUCL 33604]|uniref:Thioesterase domain-containing protein n=1 Tax=Jaapia argillacea MUCL 33604 TaxID=933084 RepID=A0A067PK22_9AGAM|nr:hypothetical protein JAAARDRAFT_41745 [Jaapia argillacea MUCL 33604]
MSGKNALALIRSLPANVLASPGSALSKLIKSIAVLLILLNIRSFPLAWHFVVFRPVFAMRFQHLSLGLRNLFKSKREKEIATERWLEGLAPVGADPFELTTIYPAYAGIDDCDFNWHLSNSSYAKTLDGARFKAALAMFPQLFPAGGWMALGATHYHFIREIPMFSKYEVRLSLGSWDSKWIYVIIRFVTPKNKKAKHQKESIGRDQSVPVVSLHTVASPSSLPTTPSDPIIPDPTALKSNAAVADKMKQLAAAQMQMDEPDGATLHCLSISQLCFKHGRVTLPPSIIFALNGFCLPPAPTYADAAFANGDAKVRRYSLTNLPPHWDDVRSMLAISNRRKLREFLRGGWRDVPEGERWWDEVLGGEIEEKRRERLEVVSLVRKGMEGSRDLH